MVWVIGNLPACTPTEFVAAQLRTPAPITGFQKPGPGQPGPVEDALEIVEGAVPRTLEAWAHAKQSDDDSPALLEGIESRARREDLWIRALPNQNPTIIVPLSRQKLLVRDAHHRAFHLAHAKTFALIRQSYYWPTIKTDVRKFLADCPTCELNKARQNTTHGLFSALPAHAPRAK
jgi:hypothetical protein